MNKKKKKDLLQKLIENKLVKLLGIIAIAYFLLGLFGVDLSQFNIMFQFFIVTIMVTWAGVSFFIFLDKKLKNLKAILKDIKTIKSMRKNIDQINKQQQNYENLLNKQNLEIKELKLKIPHHQEVSAGSISPSSWDINWGRTR